MKKIILLLSLTLLLLSCMGENNSISELTSTGQTIQDDIGTGSLTISGKWPGNSTESSNLISKSIPNDTAKMVINISNGTIDQSTNVTDTGSQTFNITFQDLTPGTWTVNVSSEDSDGNVLSKIKTKTVLITSNNNSIAAIFPPQNYAELFLTSTMFHLANDYQRWFDVLAALDVSSVEMYKRDAYQGSTSLDRFEYARWMTNSFFTYSGETVASSTTASGIIVDGYTDTDKIGELVLGSSDANGNIESATYSNIQNFKIDFGMTYGTASRLDTLSISGKVDDVEKYSESETFDYSDGRYNSSSITVNSSEWGGSSGTYANRELVHFLFGSDSSSSGIEYSLIWEGGRIVTLNSSDNLSSNPRYETRNINYDSTDTGKAITEEAVIKEEIGTETYNYYKESVTYSYDSTKTHLLIGKTVSYFDSYGIEQENRRVAFTYGSFDRVDTINYYYTEYGGSEELIFSEKLNYNTN